MLMVAPALPRKLFGCRLQSVNATLAGKLGPARLRSGRVHLEAVVLDVPGEYHPVNVTRLAECLVALEHISQHPQRIACERIAVSAAAAIAAAEALILADLHVDEIRQLG